jgi:hypothetical protein
VFDIGAMVANVIALALEMPCAFAIATLVFQMWTIFAPVEVSTAKEWRWRILLRSWDWMAGAFQMVGACDIGDVSAVASIWHSDERFHRQKLDSQPLW